MLHLLANKLQVTCERDLQDIHCWIEKPLPYYWKLLFALSEKVHAKKDVMKELAMVANIHY